ncbi:hypothetical protein EV175_000436 [Coemansia sp. RSA 1933]|nr:hypothetical protein EV175_000436 [Coemansia sp. RSA 1933]
MTKSTVTGDTTTPSADAMAPGSSSAMRGVQSAGTTGNNSDVDAEVQSNKPLFLNFTAELAPFNSAKRQKRKSNVYKVSGVNILNRNSVDSKTALERLQRRRENHNFVERRRRDNINHTITTLSTLIPYCTEDSVKLNKGSILHMAVDYIRDLQEINAALCEENARLGGSVGTTLPEALRQQRLQQQQERQQGSSTNSGIDTMPHSHDEDDMDEDENYSQHASPVLSSAATSPRFVPTNNSTNPASHTSSRASSSSALSSGGNTKNSGNKGEHIVTKKGKKRSNSSIAGNHNSSGNSSRNDVGLAQGEKALLSSSSRTAAAAPAANMLPGALGGGAPGQQMPLSASSNVSMMSPLSGGSNQHEQHRHLFHHPQKNASLGSPGHLMGQPSRMASAQSVPHSPVYSGLTHSYDTSNTASGAQTPLPPIGSITPSGRIFASGIANTSLAIHHHQQQQQMSSLHKSMVLPALNGVGPGRLPTQSMPNSPTLKSFNTHGAAAAAGVGSGKVPMQHESSAGSTGSNGGYGGTRQFNTHPFFNSDVSSIRHHIQQQAQAASHRSQQQQQQQRAYPGAHSLQNTPLMRPSRDSVFGDGFELPPIHLASDSAKRPKQS